VIVLVSGASGLVGSQLVRSLQSAGHRVLRLVRPGRPTGSDDIRWDPEGPLDPAALAGVEAVVHLAGENIAARRWSDEQRKRLRDSRVGPSMRLAETLAGLQPRPRVLVQAAAVGYYGDRGDEVLTESSPPGRGFLPSLCVEWEQASAAAAAAGIRVVHPRFGIVLSPRGGALGKMLTPFRLGVGGVVGSGRQFWPWLAVDDAVGIIERAIQDEALRGPVNAVVPEPATNREFTAALAKVLHRPSFMPLPAFALRLALGDMASLLLESVRAVPQRLAGIGYHHRFPTLEPALRHLLRRS